MRHLARRRDVPGAFFALRPDKPLERWHREDIESLMLPLVKPWDTGRGVMVSYGARPEIDAHFMAEAVQLASPDFYPGQWPQVRYKKKQYRGPAMLAY